jgi:tRNA A22 N-methylase
MGQQSMSTKHVQTWRCLLLFQLAAIKRQGSQGPTLHPQQQKRHYSRRGEMSKMMMRGKQLKKKQNKKKVMEMKWMMKLAKMQKIRQQGRAAQAKRWLTSQVRTHQAKHSL